MGIVHATCVAIDGRGVLLMGPPGAGKSDLALRLMDRGARLVSDDGVMLERENTILVASAPATIAGRMEVRGLGIVAVEHLARASVALCLDLGVDGERMPPDPLPVRMLEGIAVPVLALNPLPASASLKAERALGLFVLPA